MMRAARFFVFVPFCSLVAACGVFSSDEEPPAAGAGDPSSPTRADENAKPPISGGATPADGIYVSAAHGKDTGDGSIGAPLGTLKSAIAKAKATNKRVIACAETYAEAIDVVSGVSMFGNFDCLTYPWSAVDRHAKVTSPTSPAVTAKDVHDTTRLEGFDFVAPDGTPGSPSSIGVLAVRSGSLVISKTSIHAGTGLDGTDGTPGEQIVATLVPGQAARASHVCNIADGAECLNDDPIYLKTAAGGGTTCEGHPRIQPTGGSNGAVPGIYEFKSVPPGVDEWVARLAPAVGNGSAGANGPAGPHGASSTGGVFGELGYVVGNGTPGGDGGPGFGGNGGKSFVTDSASTRADPNHMPATPAIGTKAVNWSGGGGGAGGCPGLAGAAGTGGGTSAAVVLFESPIRLESVTFDTSNAGRGGVGAIGSEPSSGSLGGRGVCAASELVPCKAGTSGGNGGRGGCPGMSGSGAGAPSVAIAHHGAAPILEAPVFHIGSGGAGVPEQTVGGMCPRTLAAAPAGPSVEQLEF